MQSANIPVTSSPLTTRFMVRFPSLCLDNENLICLVQKHRCEYYDFDHSSWSVELLIYLFYRSKVLPYAIKKLKDAGYQLVTVAECTGLPAYQSVRAPGTRDVSS